MPKREREPKMALGCCSFCLVSALKHAIPFYSFFSSVVVSVFAFFVNQEGPASRNAIPFYSLAALFCVVAAAAVTGSQVYKTKSDDDESCGEEPSSTPRVARGAAALKEKCK